MNITPLIDDLHQSSFDELVTKLKSPFTLDIIKAKFMVENHENAQHTKLLCHGNHLHTQVGVNTAIEISSAFLILCFPNKTFTSTQGHHEVRLYQKAEELVALLKEHPTVPGHIINATEFCKALDAWRIHDKKIIEPKIKQHIFTLLDLFVQQDTEANKQNIQQQIQDWLRKFKHIFGQAKLEEFWNMSSMEDYNRLHGLNVAKP